MPVAVRLSLGKESSDCQSYDVSAAVEPVAEVGMPSPVNRTQSAMTPSARSRQVSGPVLPSRLLEKSWLPSGDCEEEQKMPSAEEVALVVVMAEREKEVI